MSQIQAKRQRARVEQILGTQQNVDAIASFWQEHGELFQIIAVASLMEFMSSRSFSSKESDLFKEGLAVMPTFFEDCWKEVERRRGDN